MKNLHEIAQNSRLKIVCNYLNMNNTSKLYEVEQRSNGIYYRNPPYLDWTKIRWTPEDYKSAEEYLIEHDAL